MLDIGLIILPVFFSGLSFILLMKVFPNFMKYPLDFKLTINNKRIFGENKTFRGVIMMSCFTSLYGTLLSALLISQQKMHILALSYFLIGLLYSLGELPNSFIKRQLGILPGDSPTSNLPKFFFKLLDTYDSLIFCGIGYLYFFDFNHYTVVLSVMLGGAFHLSTDYIMRVLKLK